MVIKLGFQYHRWQSLVLSLRLNEGKISAGKSFWRWTRIFGHQWMRWRQFSLFRQNQTWVELSFPICLWMSWDKSPPFCHLVSCHQRGVPDTCPLPILQRCAPSLIRKVGKIINTLKVISAMLMIWSVISRALETFWGSHRTCCQWETWDFDCWFFFFHQPY